MNPEPHPERRTPNPEPRPRTVLAMTLVLSLSVLHASTTQQKGACVVTAGPTRLTGLPEASGLAIGRRDSSRLWSHNDSGNAAVLFALDTTGAGRGTVRVPVRPKDWEDISAGACPSGSCLYLADIGDNTRTRAQIQIYRVPEPEPGATTTAAPDVFTASYDDGAHDAEAMFVIGAHLFIVTKDRNGGLYRATLSDSRQLTFRRTGQLGLTNVTDAEASPDESSVVVRTPGEAVFYRAGVLLDGGNTPYFRTAITWLQEPQGEGVALNGDTLYLSSEGGQGGRAGRFVRLRCSGVTPPTGAESSDPR